MDILEIRTLLRTKPIYDIPMRVTFYARVSSDSDEQLNSLDNQIAYYENFINVPKRLRSRFQPPIRASLPDEQNRPRRRYCHRHRLRDTPI